MRKRNAPLFLSKGCADYARPGLLIRRTFVYARAAQRDMHKREVKEAE
jgi:hypothetical protein